MKNYHWIVSLILLLALLAACAPTPTSVETPAKPISAPAKNNDAPTKEANAPTKEAAPAADYGPKPAGTCRVEGRSDLVAAPPVTEDDWVMGDLRARVIIMEYSDFQ